MSIEKLEAEIQVLEDKRAALFKQKAPVDAALVAAYNKIEKLRDQIADLKFKEVSADNADWAAVLRYEDGMVAYRAAERLLSEIGLRSPGGMFRESKQRVVGIQIGRRAKPETVAQVKASLEKVIPAIIPIKSELDTTQVRYIDIFEHTLSEGGIFFAEQIVETGKWRVLKTTYGRTRLIEDFKNIDDFLAAVQRNWYYDDDED